MLIERSERGGERRKEWNGREKRVGRAGRKKCTCVEEKKSEEKLEGEEKRTRENTRPWSGERARGTRGGAKVTAKQAAVRPTERARG